MPDLSLQIKASADSAIKSLDKLETKLTQLNGALDSLSNVGQFQTLADGITNLSRAMSSLKANQTAKDFSTLANNLNKISNVNYAGIGALADGLQRLSPTLKDISSSNISGSVTRLVNALTKLSSANLSGLQNANFGRVGTELAQLTNTLANTEEVSIRTTKLVEALAKLSGAGSGMVAVTNAMPGLTTQLVRFFNAMASVSTVSEGTIQLTTALAQLANAGKRASATAGSLRTLGTELNNLIGILAKSPQVANSTVELVKALSQISNQGVKINTSTSGLRTNLNSLIPSLNKVNKSTKSLASTFGMFYAKFFLLLRAVKGVWSAVKSAMDFVEVYNYFDASIDQITQKATGDWQEAGYDSAEAYYDALYEGFSTQAKELTRKMSGYSLDAQGQLTREGTKNLGLDPKTMLNYQAQFAQLSSSMGIASDYAMKMSQALTEIGADLASVKNMEFQEVWDNMSSGIVGMSRAVDKYGVNIRNTALQQKLYDLGIDASITKLGQQDKALLRAITILDSTRYAWADLSDTLEQPANQLRMLKANLDSLGRTIGGALLGGVAAILPYINALTIALQRLIQYIIDFFGIQLVSISSQANNNIGDLIGSIDDTEDALGGASGAAKKLKQNLLGIDELNIINTDDSGAGVGGGVGDYSDQLKNAFDAIYDEYQKVWDKAYENVENRAKELSDKIVNAFKKGDYYAIGNTIATGIGDALKKIPWKKIQTQARKFGEKLADFINGLFKPDTFATLGTTLTEAFNTVLKFNGGLYDNIKWENIGLSLAEFLNNIAYTIDVRQLAHNISVKIKGVLKVISTFLEETDVITIGQKIGEFLEELDWKGILSGLGEVIVHAIEAILVGWTSALSVDPFATLLITSIAGFITLNKITPIITAITTGLTGATATASVTSAGAGIGTQLVSGIMTKIKASTFASFLKADFASAGVMLSEASFKTKGMLIGGTLALGIMAAIEGYHLGKWLYEQFIEDKPTEQWFFGLLDSLTGADVTGKAQSRQQEIVDEFTKDSVDLWNAGLKDIAVQLDWSALTSTYNGGNVSDTWAKTVDQIVMGMKYIEQEGWSIKQLSEHGLWSNLLLEDYNVDPVAIKYINLMIDGYSDLSTQAKKSVDSLADLETEISKVNQAEANSVLGESSGGGGGSSKRNMAQQMQTLSVSTLDTLKTLQSFDGVLKNSNDNQKWHRDNLKKSAEEYTNLDRVIKASKGGIDLLKDSTLNSSTSMIQSLTSVSTFFTDTFSQVFGMDNITSMLSTLPKAFSVVFKNTANVVIGIFNQMIKSINQAMQVSWDDIDFGGEKVVQKGKAQLLKISPIQSFSLGGFPSGENGLFYANSSEMVGRFTNGKTAVANNDQIVAGIEQGVYNAVMSAMSQGSQNVNVVLEGDAEGIFRVVRQQNKIYKNSTGASAFA